MTNTEATAFCKVWLAAWTGNQPDQLIQFYDFKAYYQDPAQPQGLRGRDAILIYFTKLLRRNPTWVWKQEEIFLTQQGFTLKWKAEIPAPSQTLELTGLDIVELEADLITRNEVYFDPTPLLTR